MKKYYVFLLSVCMMFSHTLIADEILSQETYASYYGEAFNGKPTSSGEIFDMNAYTAAHKTLPFGTLLEVTNLENGKKVVVRVNDRGPFVGNREIDLSKAAADSLGMLNRGVARVSIKIVHSLNHAALVAAYEPRTRSAGNSVNMKQPQEKPVQTANSAAGQAGYVAKATPIAYNPPETPVQTTPISRTEHQPAMQNEPENIMPTSENNDTLEPLTSFTEHDANSPEVQPVYIPTNAKETSGPIWRIQIGSFAREENALRLVVQLRKIGLEPAYERVGNSVRVVLPGIRPEDVDKVKEALASGFFRDYVIRQESW